MPVTQPVSVPLAMDMDGETFHKHMASRHPELGMRMDGPRDTNPAVIKTVRAYHNRVHRLAENGEAYGHIHVDACELCGSVDGRDGYLLHFKEDCFK